MTITDPTLQQVLLACNTLQTKLDVHTLSLSAFPALELSPAWTSQADSPGAHGLCTIAPGPRMEVSFTPAIRPPGQPWDNIYILNRHTPINSKTFVYSLDVTFLAPTLSNCQAFEFEIQQVDSSAKVYNMAWQARFGSGFWYIFNYTSKVWEATTVPLYSTDFIEGIPTKLVAIYSQDGTSVFHHGLAVNGQWNPTVISHAGLSTTSAPYLNNAFQMDGKNQGAPILLEVSNISVIGL